MSDYLPGQEAAVDATVHGLIHGSVKPGKIGTARGVLLAAEMGVGKTRIAIEAANRLRSNLILVVCQEQLRENWHQEIRRWQVLRHPVYDFTADNFRAYSPGFPHRGWVVCNYDLLYRVPNIFNKRWDLLIADEVTKVKNPLARRTKALFKVPVNKYILLSGTPISNRLEEIATVLELLDPDNESLTRLVADCWGLGAYVDEDGRVIGNVKTPALIELQARLRATVMVRYLKADALTLPSLTTQDILVFRGVSLDNIEDRGTNDPHISRIRLRRRLLAELFKTHDRKQRKVLKERIKSLQAQLLRMSGDGKFSEVLEYLLKRHEKVIVFAHHLSLIDRYAASLRKLGRKVLVLDGCVTKQAQRLVEAFQRDPNIQFFITTITVGAYGLNMPAASLVVFAELDWDPGVMDQAVGRCHRHGQEHNVRVRQFILQGSIDEIIIDRGMRKRRLTSLALNPHPPRLVTGT